MFLLYMNIQLDIFANNIDRFFHGLLSLNLLTLYYPMSRDPQIISS